MGYSEKHLLPNENIVYRTKLHWIIYMNSIVVALIGIALIVIGIAMINHTDIDVVENGIDLGKLVQIAGAGLILLSAWGFANNKLSSVTSEFAVTNKRVLIKIGFVRRHSFELLLTQVEGIAVDQDISGRILNYGSIVILGAGGSKESFRNIKAPLEFRRQVQMVT